MDKSSVSCFFLADGIVNKYRWFQFLSNSSSYARMSAQQFSVSTNCVI